MIDNVFAKREAKKRKSSVNENSHSWVVVCCYWISYKSELVGIIDNFH